MATLCLICLISLITTATSQSMITIEANGDLKIQNVILHQQPGIRDLLVKAQQKGHDFQLKYSGITKVLGRYKTNEGQTNQLEFEKIQTKMSLYELEYHLQNGDVYYNGHQIKPTFSYMISAHGVEQEQRIPWNYQSTLHFFNRDHGDKLRQG